MISISELIGQLRSSPEFEEYLTDKFKQMSSTSSSIIQAQRRPSESATISDLLDEINETVGSLVRLHTKDQLSAIEALTRTVTQLKRQVEESVQADIKEIKAGQLNFAQDVKSSLAELNEEMTRDRKRHDKKQSALAFSFETLMAKVKALEDGSSQINFDAVKAFSESCVQDKVFEESKAKLPQKSIEQIQKTIAALEARIHDRYETNMKSIWNVLTDLEKRYDRQQNHENEKVNKTFTEQPKKRRSFWFNN